MTKIDKIAEHVKVIRERLVEKVPGHFGMAHVIAAFFGALFFGFSFVLTSLLFQVSLALDSIHLVLLTITTWTILSAEIYFVGYTRVPEADKHIRHFGQFWAKRIISYYLIGLFVAFLLLSTYGITEFAGTPFNALKLVVSVSFPASIGAAASDLLGKY